jgi:uncharacterized protein (DUF305 family)
MKLYLLAAALLVALPSAALAQETSQAGQSASSSAFEAAQQAMIEKMAQPMTGNADQDFARMMIAHHQGAIDMARSSCSSVTIRS